MAEDFILESRKGKEQTGDGGSPAAEMQPGQKPMSLEPQVYKEGKHEDRS